MGSITSIFDRRNTEYKEEKEEYYGLCFNFRFYDKDVEDFCHNHKVTLTEEEKGKIRYALTETDFRIFIELKYIFEKYKLNTCDFLLFIEEINMENDDWEEDDEEE